MDRWTVGRRVCNAHTGLTRRQFAPLLSHLQKRGFSSLLLDLETAACDSPAETLAQMEQGLCLPVCKANTDMTAVLRNPPRDIGATPFPPALIARGALCAVAEAYASSHPLSALQLIDPPLSMQRASESFPAQFAGSPLPEFNFEPLFPVRVVWTPEELAWQAAHNVPWYEAHRIEHAREDEAGESLDRYEWESMEDGAADTERWLEEEVGLYVRMGHD